MPEINTSSPYNAVPVPGAGLHTYLWTLPSGGVINGGIDDEQTVVIDWGNTTGKFPLSVLVSNSCGSFPLVTKTITVTSGGRLGVFEIVTSTDNVFHVAHGQGGHHYINLFVETTGLLAGSTVFYSLDGFHFPTAGEETFSFKLPHSSCCTAGCGYVVGVEERGSDEVTVISTEIFASEVIMCPSGDLYSAQNPTILTCSPAAGVNVPIVVESMPPLTSGMNIRAFLDGDDTYSIVASATTDITGQAVVVIPNAINGQKYWFSQTGNGYKESFGNSVTIGGSCVNLKLNETYTCGVGGANVSFAPTGGSGSYKYSFANNDAIIGGPTGYNPLTTIFLPNGLNQVYIRDEADYDYKVMYSVVVTCP